MLCVLCVLCRTTAMSWTALKPTVKTLSLCDYNKLCRLSDFHRIISIGSSALAINCNDHLMCNSVSLLNLKKQLALYWILNICLAYHDLLWHLIVTGCSSFYHPGDLNVGNCPVVLRYCVVCVQNIHYTVHNPTHWQHRVLQGLLVTSIDLLSYCVLTCQWHEWWL